MTMQFLLVPFRCEFKTEESILSAWKQDVPFILHEPGGWGVRVITRQELIIEQGKCIYVNLRYDNLTKNIRVEI